MNMTITELILYPLIIAIALALAWHDLRKPGDYFADLTKGSHKKGRKL